MNSNPELIKEKAQFYLDEKLKVFIKTIFNDEVRYYNGDILEIRDKIIILDDKFAGRTPIYISEIVLIDKARGY